MSASDQISSYHLFPFLYVFYEHQSEKPAAYWLLRLIARKYFYFVQGKYYENISSRFWESKLVFNCMFLAIYCHSPTFAVNDISKFLNTCFTFISYHIWQRHLQFRCTKVVRRYLKRPPFFWGGHRFLMGPPVAWGATGGPWRKKTSIYIYNPNPNPTSYNRYHIRNAYIYIYIYTLTQSFWTGTKVIRRKHIIQPTGFGACSSTCCQWDGEDVPASREQSNSHPPVRVQISCVNQFI